MEVEDFLAGISRQGLCTLASKFNNDIPCSSDPKTCVPTFGTFNVVIPIHFANGTKWVARIPRPGRMFAHPNPRLLERIMQSLAVTTSIVRNRTNIPVPAIYGWSSRDDNEAGCPFMFMDFVEGVSLGDCFRELPLEKTKGIIDEWAMYTWELSRLSFPAIGCLGVNHQSERVEVQKFISAGSVDQGRDTIDPYFRGPYTSVADYLFGISNLKKMAPPANLSYDRFSFGTYLENIIPFALKPEWNQGPFYLCHDDFNVQNIMVDPDRGRITAIIDWDYACVKPVQSLLSYPESLRWDLLAPVSPNFEPYQCEWSRTYRKQWGEAIALASMNVPTGCRVNVRELLDDSPFFSELERGLGESWREAEAMKFCNAIVYGSSSGEILKMSGRAMRIGPWMSIQGSRAGYLLPPDIYKTPPAPISPKRQSFSLMVTMGAGGVVRKRARKVENAKLSEWDVLRDRVKNRRKRISQLVGRWCQTFGREEDDVTLTESDKGKPAQANEDWWSVLGRKFYAVKGRSLNAE